MPSKAILVSDKTKEQLDQLKSHHRDTYDDVVTKLIKIHDKYTTTDDPIFGVDLANGKDKTIYPSSKQFQGLGTLHGPTGDTEPSETQETSIDEEPHSEKNSQENSEEIPCEPLPPELAEPDDDKVSVDTSE